MTIPLKNNKPLNVVVSVAEIYAAIDLMLEPLQSDEQQRCYDSLLLLDNEVNRICHDYICMTGDNYQALATLAKYGIESSHYHKVCEQAFAPHNPQLKQLYDLIEYWRDHGVVSLNYMIEPNFALRIHILVTEPSRDYDGILRAEVQKAIDNNEFVPFKYLKVLGLA